MPDPNQDPTQLSFGGGGSLGLTPSMDPSAIAPAIVPSPSFMSQTMQGQAPGLQPPPNFGAPTQLPPFPGSPGAGAGDPHPGDMAMAPGLAPPPHPDFLKSIAQFLPVAIGGALALTAGRNRYGNYTPQGRAQLAMGAGLGMGAAQPIEQQQQFARQQQMQQQADQQKQFQGELSELIKAGGYNDPEARQIIQEAQGGGTLAPNQIAQLRARIANLGGGQGIQGLQSKFVIDLASRRAGAMETSRMQAAQQFGIDSIKKQIESGGMQLPPGETSDSMAQKIWAQQQEAQRQAGMTEMQQKMAGGASLTPGANFGLTPEQVLMGKRYDKEMAMANARLAQEQRRNDIMEQYHQWEEGGKAGAKLSNQEKMVFDSIDSVEPLIANAITTYNQKYGTNIPLDINDDNTYNQALAETQKLPNNILESGWQKFKGEKLGMGYSEPWDKLNPQLQHLAVVARSPYMQGTRSYKAIQDIKKFTPDIANSDQKNAQEMLGLLRSFGQIRNAVGTTQSPPGLASPGGGKTTSVKGPQPKAPTNLPVPQGKPSTADDYLASLTQ